MRGVAKRRDFPLSESQRKTVLTALHAATAGHETLLRRLAGEGSLVDVSALVSLAEEQLRAMWELKAELEAFDDVEIVRKSFAVETER